MAPVSPRTGSSNYRPILSKLEAIPQAAVSTGRVFGRGNFKTVNLGLWRDVDVVLVRFAKDSQPLAKAKAVPVKPIALVPTKDQNENELRILQHLCTQAGSKEFIPAVYGVVFELRAAILVQEFAPWGCMKDAFANPKFRGNAVNLHYLHAAAQLARAMDFVAGHRIVHADLAARNVLLSSFEENPLHPDGCVRVKLTDFGLSVLLQGDEDYVVIRQPITTRWGAPEAVARYTQSWRSDVWALGCTVWEMYAGTAPWPNVETRMEVREQLRALAELGEKRQLEGGEPSGGEEMASELPIQAPLCPPVVHSVVLSTLEANEFLRPTFAEFAETLELLISAGGEPAELPCTGRLSDGRNAAAPSKTTSYVDAFPELPEIWDGQVDPQVRELEEEAAALRHKNSELRATMASLCRTIGVESVGSNASQLEVVEKFDAAIGALKERLSDLEKQENENAALRDELSDLQEVVQVKATPVEAKEVVKRPRVFLCMNWFRNTEVEQTQ